MSDDCLEKHPTRKAYCNKMRGHQSDHRGKVEGTNDYVTWPVKK